MAIRVVEAALDHPPVTFAIHGHPLIAVHPPFLVLEMANALGLRVEVLPGISAIDTLLADLRIDPVVHGVQMYEATDLLLRRRPLQNDVPAIIWQVGTLETGLHSQRVSRPERFARFLAHLRQYYPAAAPGGGHLLLAPRPSASGHPAVCPRGYGVARRRTSRGFHPLCPSCHGPASSRLGFGGKTLQRRPLAQPHAIGDP